MESYYEEKVIEAGGVSFKVQEREGVIEHLELPFSAVQWVDLANREGQWLPACCGNISHARELLMSCLHNNKRIGAHAFRDLVLTIIEHDDGLAGLDAKTLEEWEAAAIRWALADPESPLLVIGHIWFAVRDRLAEDRDEIVRVDLDSASEALGALHWGSAAIRWALGEASQEETSACKAAEITLAIARLAPALHTLRDRLETLAPPPFEGFILLHKDTEEIVGLPQPLIFHSIEHLRRRLSSNLSRDPCRFMVRRCRVSLADGIVLGDLVPDPMGAPDNAPERLRGVVERAERRVAATGAAIERWREEHEKEKGALAMARAALAKAEDEAAQA